MRVRRAGARSQMLSNEYWASSFWETKTERDQDTYTFIHGPGVDTVYHNMLIPNKGNGVKDLGGGR